jgi:MarR family transcriptional regulator, organic hydroperoxide resistance regulator
MRTRTTVRQEIRQTRPFRSTAEEAAVGLLLTADLLIRRLAAVLEPAGITVQQYNVLRILRGSHPEPLPTLEIAERMIERTPGITRLLDRLEAKGLVARARGRDDRRCVYCRITARGLALTAELDEPVHAVDRAAFATLGRSRQRELVARLDEVRAALRGAASASNVGDVSPRAEAHARQEVLP